RSIDCADRRERAAGHAPRAADRGRRLRARCVVERRLPSLGDGGAYPQGRGVLQRHDRRPSGVHFGGQVRVSLSGTAVLLATPIAWRAVVGRAEFLTQFPSIVDFMRRSAIADPASAATFERCRLDLTERQTHASAYALHEDLLRLRREHTAFNTQRPDGLDGAVLSPSAFALRFFTPDHADDRLLLVNLGGDLKRTSFAEPLLAPPVDTDWALAWSSEDPKYDGSGTPDL